MVNITWDKYLAPSNVGMHLKLVTNDVSLATHKKLR